MKPKFEEGDRVYSTDKWAEGQIGTVVKVDPNGGGMPYSVKFDKWETPLWKREENMKLYKDTFNHKCGNLKMYHDKKEEWVCPFCDL